MKNCIEHPDQLAPDFDLSAFSPTSQAKLARHLSGEETDPVGLTDEDLRLFIKAAEKWSTPSLHHVCHQAWQARQGAPARPGEAARRRTQSEHVVSQGQVHAPPIRRDASTQSFGTPGSARRKPQFDTPSYLLLFGEANGKTCVIVFSIKNHRIHQKPVDISKPPGHLKSVTAGYVEDAPFLFFLHVCPKNNVNLTAYDVIDDKMKPRPKLKQRCEITSVVSTGSTLICFPRNSDRAEVFNIEKKKWARPFKLHHVVNDPVLVAHEERVYIFHENTVQCYDVITGTVTSSSISEFVSTGYGFVFEGRVNILTDGSRVEYDVISGHCRRFDFPGLGYRPIHKAFARNGQVYVLFTNPKGKFELANSSNMFEWNKVVSFPKTMELVCTEILDYISSCPFAPFETFDESIRQPKFTLS